MISGEAAIRIGHGEVFLKRDNLELYQNQWWRLLLRNLNVIHMHSNWFCWKAQEKFQMASRFCKTTAFSYVTLLTSYSAMFKVSNRNTRKRCLFISKITLKPSERRHLINSYLWNVTVQNHVLDSFSRIYTNLKSKFCFQFCFQVRQPVILTMENPLYFILWEMRKCQHFFISEKTTPKTDKFSNFLPYGPPFQHHKVTHPNFL